MNVLFFSPHATIDVHSLPEALVAESLQNSGHEIIYVTCNKLYSKFCLCFSHLDYSDHEHKKKICESCVKKRDVILGEFKFKEVSINQYVTEPDIKRANDFISKYTSDNYVDIVIDNVPIGKYSLYEFTLNHKLKKTVIPDDLIDEYLAILENTILTYFASKKIIEVFSPVRVVTYNSLYSVNRTVCAVAEQFKTPHFTLHAGSHHKKRIQQMTVFKGITNSALVNRHHMVDISRSTPCSESQVQLVSDHIFELLRATSPWVYSVRSSKLSCADVRKKIGVTEKQKVILAVMRSGDERYAAELVGVDIFQSQPIFNSQIEWCEWLINFAQDNPDKFIVFRVHPREFPNKRESVTSQNAVELLNFIEKITFPSNFFFNLPADNISLHDLLKISDVVLNNSSSAGLEASLFGIPVIGIGDDLFSFDPFLQIEPHSKQDYGKLIYLNLEKTWEMERVIFAFRWLRYLLDYVSIDISDGYKNNEDVQLLGRLFHYAVRVMRKLGIKNENIILNRLKNRPTVLAEREWLNYAIEGDRDSHIGIKKLKKGVSTVEKSMIHSAYIAYMNSISSDLDDEFQTKIISVFRELDN